MDNVCNDDDNSHKESNSDYVSCMNISLKRGTAFLRKQNVRAQAYSEIYYDYTKSWKAIYYSMHFIFIAINLGGAIAALTIFENDNTAKIIASVASIVAGSMGIVTTVVNPGREMKICEDAGDSYSLLAADLELFDPQTISIQDLNTLVKLTANRFKKNKKEYPEPDQKILRKTKKEIVDRIRLAKETLLYLEVDDGNNVNVNSADHDLVAESKSPNTSINPSQSQFHLNLPHIQTTNPPEIRIDMSRLDAIANANTNANTSTIDASTTNNNQQVQNNHSHQDTVRRSLDVGRLSVYNRSSTLRDLVENGEFS